MDALDPYFEQADEAAHFVTVFANVVSRRNRCFELNWTFESTRCLDVIESHLRRSRAAESMALSRKGHGSISGDMWRIAYETSE